MKLSKYYFRQIFQLPWSEQNASADEALLKLICLSIILDGEITPDEFSEAERIITQLYLSEAQGTDGLKSAITQAIRSVHDAGPDATLAFIIEHLESKEEMATGIKIAGYFGQLDGRVVPIEHMLMHDLIQRMDITKEEADQAISELQEILSAHQRDTLSNPFLASYDLPQFDALEVHQIQPAVHILLEELEAKLAIFKRELALNDAPSFEDVVEPLDLMGHRLGYTWGLIGHLLSVKNSPELRDVYQEVEPTLVSFSIKLSQDPDIYKAVEAIYAKPDDLDEAQMRIVESMVRDARHSGVGLEGEEKEHFNAIQMEMAKLKTSFSNNVLDATNAFELILISKDEVLGLPPSMLQLAAQSARESGLEDATAEDGPWRITLDGPSLMPVLNFSEDRALRERVYRAYLTRANGEGGYDNVPVIQRILQLRREQAQLLGSETYAELSLSSKMAPNVAAVDTLLEELREASYEAAKDDMQELQAFATSEGASYAQDLKQWDVGFWSERLREDRYGYNAEQLKPYFPLPHVLSGLFSLIGKLFDVRVAESASPVQVWHDDVRFYEVFDNKDTRVAAFYLDPYSRPAQKRGGAWHNTCQNRSKLMAPQGEDVRIPISYLVCNQTPPVGDQPSLMSFREVLTLFHEFGHGLQHMLTQVDYTMIAGISGIEWDAVELPSQFMENWCYQTSILKDLTSHVETGESLPDTLIEKLQAAKNFRAGSGMLRQLYFGMTDIRLHHDYDPTNEDTSPFDIQREVAEKTSLLPLLPEDRFLCAFSHIFAGGYAAGYYSYKWAEVLSADAFAAFEEVGLQNDDAVIETGRRFRDTVLSMGGGKHPMEVFAAFRGREPSTEPLLRHYGLKN